MHTETQFYAKAKKVCDEHNVSEDRWQMVAMYCAENGMDCGDRAWEVAVNTLDELVDQGLVNKVADTGSAY